MKKITLILITLIILSNLCSAQCWVHLSTGATHTLAIKNDGTLWAWGGNLKGQLGDGTTTNRNIPQQISTDTDWASVSAAYGFFSTAIKTNGTLWAWGYNIFGQLGDGTTADKLTPVQVGTATDWASVSAGQLHTLAIKTNGTLWAWGENGGGGALGDGGLVASSQNPIQIGSDTDWKKVYAGHQYSMSLKKDSTLWVWGANPFGQLGDGTNMTKKIPTLIGSMNDKWIEVAMKNKHSMALSANGTIWTTGDNTYGQLGDGTTTSKLSFTQIGVSTWKKIAAGASHSLAINTDGTLWSWGYNVLGQLGDGSYTDKHSPVLTDTISSWVFIDGGSNHSIVHNTDKELWTWGSNGYGELGDGSIVNSRTSPVQIQITDCNQFPTANSNFSTPTSIPFYPNPTFGIVHFPELERVNRIQLINLEGQTVKNINVEGNAIIDVSNLPSGIYFIKFISSEFTQMQKLTINH